ncbi:MAG TPA: hypothetical protein P5277_01820 [Candidatus Paceibacterota bacterium]|nr:hypothetical protein [Candidatus Paceibacterota bacterium]
MATKKAEHSPKSILPREQQIGFHKGAIQTLVNERNELIRLVQVTEALIKAHIEELKKLGVNLENKQ